MGLFDNLGISWDDLEDAMDFIHGDDEDELEASTEPIIDSNEQADLAEYASPTISLGEALGDEYDENDEDDEDDEYIDEDSVNDDEYIDEYSVNDDEYDSDEGDAYEYEDDSDSDSNDTSSLTDDNLFGDDFFEDDEDDDEDFDEGADIDESDDSEVISQDTSEHDMLDDFFGDDDIEDDIGDEEESPDEDDTSIDLESSLFGDDDEEDYDEQTEQVNASETHGTLLHEEQCRQQKAKTENSEAQSRLGQQSTRQCTSTNIQSDKVNQEHVGGNQASQFARDDLQSDDASSLLAMELEVKRVEEMNKKRVELMERMAQANKLKADLDRQERAIKQQAKQQSAQQPKQSKPEQRQAPRQVPKQAPKQAPAMQSKTAKPVATRQPQTMQQPQKALKTEPDTPKLTKEQYYSGLDVDTLYKYVKKCLIENGVNKAPVDISILEAEFGSKNVNRLIMLSYIIKIKGKVTIGR